MKRLKNSINGLTLGPSPKEREAKQYFFVGLLELSISTSYFSSANLEQVYQQILTSILLLPLILPFGEVWWGFPSGEVWRAVRFGGASFNPYLCRSKKVAYWYAVQVSDTTMSPRSANAGNTINKTCQEN